MTNSSGMDFNHTSRTYAIVVKGENDKRMLCKIDSYHPAFFAQLLIINLANYVTEGKWFWNPKSTP